MYIVSAFSPAASIAAVQLWTLYNLQENLITFYSCHSRNEMNNQWSYYIQESIPTAPLENSSDPNRLIGQSITHKINCSETYFNHY